MGMMLISNTGYSQLYDIEWENMTLVSYDSITQTLECTRSGSGWGSSGASSVNRLNANTDGLVEYIIHQTGYHPRMFGLTNDDSPNSSYSTIGYAWYVVGGSLQIYEGGVGRGSFGSSTLGVNLKVAREGNIIKYYKDGIVVRQVTTNATKEMVVDVAFYNNGGELKDVQSSFVESTPIVVAAVVGHKSLTTAGEIDIAISGGIPPYTVSWNNGIYLVEDLTNIEPGVYDLEITDSIGDIKTVSYNVLYHIEWENMTLVSYDEVSKTLQCTRSGGGWNASGASSVNRLNSNTDGFVEYVIHQTGYRPRMFGLTKDNSPNSSYSTIDYAWYVIGGNLQIYESGSNRGNFGSSTSGLNLKVAREGNVIKYYKDGIEVRQVSTDATKEMVVDVALYNNGGELKDVLSSFSGPCQTNAQIDFSKDTVRFLDTVEINYFVRGTYGQISVFDYNNGSLLTKGILFDEDSPQEIQIQQNIVFPYVDDLALPVGKYIIEILAFDSISTCEDTIYAYDTLTIMDVEHQFQVAANILHIGTEDSTGIIDISSVSGGTAPYTYSWNTGENTSSINNLTGGIYQVIISDNIGAKDSFNFLVNYQMIVESSDAFAKDNEGHVIKHPNALYDDELMVSKDKFDVNSDDALFAKFFEGTNGSNFSLGFDSNKENISSFNLEFEVRAINSELFAYQDGLQLEKIGTYYSNDELIISFSGGEIMIIKNMIPIHTFEVNNGAVNFYAKIGFSNGTKLLSLQASSLWMPDGFTENYATLTKKLDAGYYVMRNDIKYKYKEKYNDNTLNYKVYDWKRDVKMDETFYAQSNHGYGVGYYRLEDAHQYLNDGEFYTMEITNDKNEVYKMRFKFDREIKNPLLPIIPFPVGTINTGDITNCCQQLIKRCCYPNGLNPVQLFGQPKFTLPLNFYELYQLGD